MLHISQSWRTLYLLFFLLIEDVLGSFLISESRLYEWSMLYFGFEGNDLTSSLPTPITCCLLEWGVTIITPPCRDTDSSYRRMLGFFFWNALWTAAASFVEEMLIRRERPQRTTQFTLFYFVFCLQEVYFFPIWQPLLSKDHSGETHWPRYIAR